MLSRGFGGAPVTRSLTYGIVAASILASITDVKHYFFIQIDPHLWRYHQLWRVFTYQLCYTNSTEVLFAAMTLYNLRVVERLWGSRKYASFIILCYCLTALLPPIILALILRPLSFNKLNYLPAGPTPIIFAVLAQYHAIIPHIYKYRVAASAAPPTNEPFVGLTFSDKSYVYLPAAQLSLSQFPGSLLCACVGWVVGYSWRNEVLPGALVRWRIPGWMVGIKSKKREEDFEALRRRLESENTGTAAATGSDGRLGGEEGRRRPLGVQLVDQFRGAF
ncbi:Rhomboid-like protein [Venustampulla echinocandica]|uniref:Rhomboid-like protein n=1 Tax=Venustampulla echinocandica TaxID=2656787 RepID=A0A370U036_9HELO|nr:Rhomboid-like protein [Venustampulla echinocandica]RDL41131.1 Rhomboid-like protein [Venustampulla echinocandica]